MPINDVLPVSAARRDLTTLIARSTPTVIGPYGKAAAVLVPIACYRAAPDDQVAKTMLSGLASQVAASRLWTASAPRPAPRIVGQMRIDATTRGSVTEVLRWLWDSGQHQMLMRLLADILTLVAQVPEDAPEPSTVVTNLLTGLDPADAAQALAMAREWLPGTL